MSQRIRTDVPTSFLLSDYLFILCFHEEHALCLAVSYFWLRKRDEFKRSSGKLSIVNLRKVQQTLRLADNHIDCLLSRK